jgi:hypothetical protein
MDRIRSGAGLMTGLAQGTFAFGLAQAAMTFGLAKVTPTFDFCYQR